MNYHQYRERLSARFSRPELAFGADEYESRLGRVRQAMDREGLDLVLMTDPAALCYLTGYTTFEVSVQCVLLISAQTTGLYVPAIEIGPAVYLSRVDEVTGYPWESPAALVGLLQTRIAASDIAATPTIGVSAWSHSLSSGLLDALRSTLDTARCKDMGDLLDAVRLVKSPAELEYLAQSAAITAVGLDAAAGAIHEGVVDHRIASGGAAAMLAAGSEFMSMQPIVATGLHSGIIHTNHAGRVVARGDAVFTEFGAARRRYTAPMMRTAVVGGASAQMRMFHAVCREIFEAVADSARPGESFADAARAGEAALAPVADRAFFSGVYGYPVGAQFPPSWVAGSAFITRDSTAVFANDMVFHLPICLRKPGEWGIGFSETVRITPAGAKRITDNDWVLREVG